MSFDEPAVKALVRQFCRYRNVDAGTSFTVVSSLEHAIRIAELRGPDNRFRKINLHCDPADFPDNGSEYRTTSEDFFVYDFIVRRPGMVDSWFLSNIVVSANHWTRFSTSMRTAHELGVGWIVPARNEVLIVPRPTVRFAEGRRGVFHDDTGRKAIEWRNGAGYYFLHGTEFDESLYFKVIGSKLLIQQIAALSDADQRSIALSYLTFEQLVVDSDSDLIDTGVKGTRLYRLPLPPRIARDRVPGYGRYDYFIHMRDASHPEREFIEWVDPRIGRQRNAELCQAHAFGITLDDWLSIEQEG